MRIAVIGAGVSGLGAAYAMKDLHEVVLFEKDARLGGHANTALIEYDGEQLAVDTGFIVFNEGNYPNLTRLFAHLGIETFASDMSFAVSDPNGVEWSSGGLKGVFAWKRNLTRPAFLCMLGDIVRFSAQARLDLQGERINGATLEEYVSGLGLGRRFLSDYLLPMGAAIWSTPEREMLRYPAASFLRFFDNHRLLYAKRPKWRSVVGGSRSYVDALRAALGSRVRSSAPVEEVLRDGHRVGVRTQGSETEWFDQVVLACHADQALGLIANPTDAERAALSVIRYAPNTAYLHRDDSLMPARRAAWSSWNYLRQRGDGVCVSYWMNRLQNLPADKPTFVTLNPPAPPEPELTFGRYEYEHPQFDAAALAAQAEIKALQGHDRLWFAGAWLGNGFHEDGLRSGLEVAHQLGAHVPWREYGLGEQARSAASAAYPVSAAA